MVEGHEVFYITCRACAHTVARYEVGNSLVGCQDRMRCKRCGHVGADLLRVWTQGPRPARR